MRVIKKPTLRTYWTKHPDAKGALEGWLTIALRQDWASAVEVRESFRNADVVGEFIVFNICKNAYRLVVRADYGRGILYVYGFYNHAEYDRLDLRAIDAELGRRPSER